MQNVHNKPITGVEKGKIQSYNAARSFGGRNYSSFHGWT